MKKKEKLLREIKKLERKEKNVKSKLKSSNVQVGKEHNPQIIIEEINRKNREYEMLRSRYNSLMGEMNNKIIQDSSRIYQDNKSV